METPLRIILFIVSVVSVVFVVRKIRKANLKIEYSLFWIVFSFLLLVLSIFPNLTYVMAKLCAIEAPVNFIFLFMIFLLLLHSFYLTLKTSRLENMIQNLTQEIAIRSKIEEDEAGKKAKESE